MCVWLVWQVQGTLAPSRDEAAGGETPMMQGESSSRLDLSLFQRTVQDQRQSAFSLTAADAAAGGGVPTVLNFALGPLAALPLGVVAPTNVTDDGTVSLRVTFERSTTWEGVVLADRQSPSMLFAAVVGAMSGLFALFSLVLRGYEYSLWCCGCGDSEAGRSLKVREWWWRRRLACVLGWRTERERDGGVAPVV
jgi:hypothetical protein